MSGTVAQGLQKHTACCRHSQMLFLGDGLHCLVGHPCCGVAMDGGKVCHVAVSKHIPPEREKEREREY